MNLENIIPKDGPSIEEVKKYIEKYKNDLIVIKYGAVSYTHLTLPTKA